MEIEAFMKEMRKIAGRLESLQDILPPDLYQETKAWWDRGGDFDPEKIRAGDTFADVVRSSIPKISEADYARYGVTPEELKNFPIPSYIQEMMSAVRERLRQNEHGEADDVS